MTYGLKVAGWTAVWALCALVSLMLALTVGWDGRGV